VIVPFLTIALAVADPGETPSPDAGTAAAAPADCSVVDGAAAAAILGYSVTDPDPTSRSGGTCFYVSERASEDGTLSYGIVTADSLPQRRAYFHAFSRRCAPAVKGTLNELACRQYIALSQATDMNAYFAARTGAGDASPVPGLGDSAVISGSALYVRRGNVVYEMSVTRGGDFDLERTTQLAHALLTGTKAS
jgi:hypothetical protein